MAEGMALGRATPSFDAEPNSRVGLISLASDPVSSDEVRAVLGCADRAIHETRIANSDRIDLRTLAAMEGRLAGAAGLLPSTDRYDAAAYLCTSASMVMGSDHVAALVGSVLKGARICDPMSAVCAALDRLGARRIGLVTPYVREVTDGIATRLTSEGVEVVNAVSFFVDVDSRVARIAPDAILHAATQVADRADAVFVSCTALRTVGHAAAWERALGVPVVSSNLAVAWQILTWLGGKPAPGDWGRLIGTLNR